MSCYFRYMRDVLKEAGILVTPKNKKEIDQAIHKMVKVQYKKCMPDCWGEVKKRLSEEKVMAQSWTVKSSSAMLDKSTVITLRCSGPLLAIQLESLGNSRGKGSCLISTAS